MAMAVVSRVPRMAGSRPKWPWVGSQVFWKIQEKPSVEKAGWAFATMATTNQTTRATKRTTTLARAVR